MREIKFRGQRVSNKEWVYGSLVNNLWTYADHHSFYPNHVCEIITGKYEGDCWQDVAEDEDNAIVTVIPETVGQLTGLKDKNGKDIYEGDICSGHSDGNGVITWTDFDGGYDYVFDDGANVGIWEVKPIIIIGNIHQHNPINHDR